MLKPRNEPNNMKTAVDFELNRTTTTPTHEHRLKLNQPVITKPKPSNTNSSHKSQTKTKLNRAKSYTKAELNQTIYKFLNRNARILHLSLISSQILIPI